MNRIIRHLNKFNKVGAKHYALAKDGQNMEMYARKVALLQVLKYMPQSVEVQRAMDVAAAVDSGKNFTFDGDIVEIKDEDDAGHSETAGPEDRVAEVSPSRPECSPEKFSKKTPEWRALILDGKKTVKELIATIESKELLTEDQKTTIDAWSHEND